MNDYGMTIIAGGREIEIPVLPQKLKVTSPGNNDKATVLVLGDILILRKKGLRTVAWDSFFPVNDAPFVTGRITDPVEIVRAIQDARDELDPVRFLITGTDLDINVRMGVETFDYDCLLYTSSFPCMRRTSTRTPCPCSAMILRRTTFFLSKKH